MNIGGDCQQKQHQGAGNYNQYDYNSSVGGISGKQVNTTNTIPPLPRGPALVQPVNKKRSGHSDSVDWDQCSTLITSFHHYGNTFGRR